MRDFNFFEPYIDKKETEVTRKQFILYIATTAIVIAALFYPLVNIFQQHRIKGSITAMQMSLEADETYEKIQRIEEKQQRINRKVTKLATLTEMEENLKQQSFIDDQLMYTITGTIPQEIFFERLTFTNNIVEIQGYAVDKAKIALLEQRLHTIPDFVEIFIPSISIEEGFYRFTLTFTIKEVTADETNQ
ncbi:MAG: PilN domain-containing protein [Clostridiaceae bacterium]|nr:PilN domain-containing protein [Clostridiaceae bacterium]